MIAGAAFARFDTVPIAAELTFPTREDLSFRDSGFGALGISAVSCHIVLITKVSCVRAETSTKGAFCCSWYLSVKCDRVITLA